MKKIEILERDGWVCQLCGIATPRELRGSIHPHAPEVDHIIPRSRDGSDEPENLRCLCRACNQDKLSFLDTELGNVFAADGTVIDMVVFLEATRRHREGSSRGGSLNKGKKLGPRSDEDKEKISRGTIEAMSDPTFRERFNTALMNRDFSYFRTEEYRTKMSQPLMGKNKGVKRTAEQRENIKRGMADVDFSARTKAGWSDERKQQQSETLTGRKFSDETKKKIGEKSRQKKMSVSAKIRIGRAQYYLKSKKNRPLDFIDIWESQGATRCRTT